ncbi:MAG: fructosamine kinase family protein [Firmicutes bacterium]|nr:fructosamine kinase family protein [Bacillota bacterium]
MSGHGPCARALAAVDPDGRKGWRCRPYRQAREAELLRLEDARGRPLALAKVYNGRRAAAKAEVERRGLEALAATGTVAVPAVVAAMPDGLVMDWIEPAGCPAGGALARTLGEDLAALHALPAPAYGLPFGNAVGVLSGPTPSYEQAGPFYVRERLDPLVTALAARGAPAALLDRLQAAREVLARRLPSPVPALLHGDLWSGNWLPGRGPDGRCRPYLIDPAVLWGDPVSELAFSECFGGFPAAFYEAYRALRPLPPDYRTWLRPAYQLYHALMHWWLFGDGYRSWVAELVELVLQAHPTH